MFKSFIERFFYEPQGRDSYDYQLAIAQHPYIGKTFCVLGMGLTGRSVIKWLLENNIAGKIYIFDDIRESCVRAIESLTAIKELNIGLIEIIERPSLTLLLQIDIFVLSPGIAYLPESIEPTSKTDILELSKEIKDMHAVSHYNTLAAIQDKTIRVGDRREPDEKKYCRTLHNCTEIAEVIKILVFSATSNNELATFIRNYISQSFNPLLLSDFDLFDTFLPEDKPIRIGVTGTNGKSTIASMIFYMLTYGPDPVCKNTALGGNIGVPCLQLPIFYCSEDIYVFEMSSFQIDLLHNMSFDIAICSNITPDHLDRYVTMERYTASKFGLFRHLDSDQIKKIAIICLDSQMQFAILHELLSIGNIAVIGISVFETHDTRNIDCSFLKTVVENVNFSFIEIILTKERGGLSGLSIKHCRYIKEEVAILYDFHFTVTDSFLCTHNVKNIGIVIATALTLNIPSHIIIESIMSFKPLPHRVELCFAWNITRDFRVIKHEPIFIDNAIISDKKPKECIQSTTIIISQPKINVEEQDIDVTIDDGKWRIVRDPEDDEDISEMEDDEILPRLEQIILQQGIEDQKAEGELQEYEFTVNFINDSKGTNFDATVNALIDRQNAIWIVGGLYKGGDFEIFANQKQNVMHAYIIGSSTELFATAMNDMDITYSIVYTIERALEDFMRNLEKFLEAALRREQEKDSQLKADTLLDRAIVIDVLLAPACSSLDQWKNFEARGEFFRTKVHELIEHYEAINRRL